MHYRSIAQLNTAVRGWRLPPDIEAVVGIPRSGMLVADLLGVHRNLPIADLDGFLQGRTLASGKYKAVSDERFFETPRSVLVVDDSYLTGRELGSARLRVEEAGMPHEVRYGVVYALPGRETHVDFVCESVPAPRLFEWNVMHNAWWLEQSCVDIDGVLCVDPSRADNDDGARYERFLAEAAPLLRPSATVGWLVSARLEKYRAQTEAWLEANGISYRELVLLDLPSKEERLRLGLHAQFKADVYVRTGARLFIESSETQARDIARLSGRPVLSIESGTIVAPSRARQASAAIRAPRYARQLARDRVAGAFRRLRR